MKPLADKIHGIIAATALLLVGTAMQAQAPESRGSCHDSLDMAVDSIYRQAKHQLQEVPDFAATYAQADSVPDVPATAVPNLDLDLHARKGHFSRGTQQSIYDLPYSLTGRCYDWRRLWINTGVLTGAFVGTLFVLECLPEDATSWNRAALQDVPLFTRWRDHVLKKGPEWDHDKFVFNYVLHPYAGAAYFMGARSCGFNFYQSLLYSTLISTVGWEFGIEAFMERPSYQDLFITPLVGSAIGEGFYRLKRHLVDNDYRLFGSPVVGNIVAFLIDPLNEVVGIFDHNPARRVAREKAAARGQGVSATLVPGYKSLTLRVTF